MVALPTASPSPTLGWSLSQGSQVQVAPSPAYHGQAVLIRFDHAPASCQMDVYALDGSRVGGRLITQPDQAQWSTDKVASGLYVMVLRLDNGEGTNGIVTKKVVVIR